MGEELVTITWPVEAWPLTEGVARRLVVGVRPEALEEGVTRMVWVLARPLARPLFAATRPVLVTRVWPAEVTRACPAGRAGASGCFCFSRD